MFLSVFSPKAPLSRIAMQGMIALTSLAVAATIGLRTARAAETAASSKASPNTAHTAVKVSDGWVRWLPGKLPAAAYMTLENSADAPVDLVGADSPDYQSVMLHRSVNNGATSTMIMTDKLALPPHRSLAISPGNYHFMLSDATHPIAPGASVQLTLHFSDGSQLTTRLPVSPPTRMQ